MYDTADRKSTTAPRRAQLAQSRSDCSSSGLSGWAFVFGVYGETNEATRAEISEMAKVGAANRWRDMGQTSQVKAYCMQSSSTYSRGRWASLPSLQTPACTCGCFPSFQNQRQPRVLPVLHVYGFNTSTHLSPM
jgi:hypothetical protein